MNMIIFQGYADIVRLLLEHGAKVEETNENGHTPLVIKSFSYT